MCRIFGHLNCAVPAAELRAVAALQRHGGPDATGAVRGPGWGLGADRLAVIDPDGGRQPYDLDGRVAVVFNGEIYNHDELRARLRARGYSFADRCDGNVIAPLYDAYGPGFVDLLDGMFAFALMDLSGRPRLLLATDGVGMKPVYLHYDGAARALYFASEIPALLGFSAVPDTVWELGLDAGLTGRTPLGERTMLERVTVLPPSTTLLCEMGGTPQFTTRTRKLAGLPTGPALVAADVRETLRREVGRLLVADVPVAVVCSGGLDSSLVTALAAERGETHAFTVSYRGSWPFDEKEHARAVTRSVGAVHHEVEVDPAAFPELLERTVRHLGQPNADPITVSTLALFEQVRAAGFVVALTGDGADEMFGGYARMLAAVRDAAAGRDWMSAYVDAVAVAPAAVRDALYTPEYRALVAGTEPLPGMAALRNGPGTPLRRVVAFEQERRLPAYHLRRVDHLSMAASVEARLPFCQPAVAAIGAALSDDLRIRDGAVKTTLYAAAAGLLPEQVLNRPKQPFTLPVAAMLTPGTPLWAYARDVLAPESLRAGGQLDPRAVETMFDQQAAAPDDVAARTLWALTVHECWRAQLRSGRHGSATTGQAVAA